MDDDDDDDPVIEEKSPLRDLSKFFEKKGGSYIRRQESQKNG